MLVTIAFAALAVPGAASTNGAQGTMGGTASKVQAAALATVTASTIEQGETNVDYGSRRFAVGPAPHSA
jgi:hypothetical protein